MSRPYFLSISSSGDLSPLGFPDRGIDVVHGEAHRLLGDAVEAPPLGEEVPQVLMVHLLPGDREYRRFIGLLAYHRVEFDNLGPLVMPGVFEIVSERSPDYLGEIHDPRGFLGPAVLMLVDHVLPQLVRLCREQEAVAQPPYGPLGAYGPQLRVGDIDVVHLASALR